MDKRVRVTSFKKWNNILGMLAVSIFFFFNGTPAEGKIIYYSGFETGSVINTKTGTAEDNWWTLWENCKEPQLTGGVPSPWAWNVVNRGEVLNSNDESGGGANTSRWELHNSLRSSTTRYSDGL